MAAPKSGGFKMSLGGLKNKPGFKAAAIQKETKKPRLALGEDEPDDSVKQQEISGWDAAEGGAVDISGPKVKEGPRIIPVQPNRNWRAEAQRKKLAKAPHAQQQNGVDPEKMEVEPTVQYGLTIMQKKPEEEATEETTVEVDAMDVDVKDDLTEEQRLEKRALDALVSGSSADNELVIPFQTEDDVLHNDLNEAPDAPSLAAYEATPIEGFGAALLRGMGWKDGDTTGKAGTKKPKETKRRPALFGIGAKEEAAVGVELGAFKAKGKGKTAVQYNPVTLRNKHTGEMITEEELKAKLENQDLVPEEEKASSTRRRHDDESDDSFRRDKRRDRTDDRRDDRRRDKYADDSDRRREKRSHRDDEDHDSERRRDKRRERDDDHDSERRRDKRRDRDRSRSPDDDSRRERRRERHRSRSRERDSKDRRRERSRSRDDEERRRRRRDREREYDDERERERRRYKEDKYRK
jgi:hypothetical protein